jgi:hypothetical protein
MTYHIDSAAKMLLVTCEGIVGQSERLEAMKAWMSDPAYRPGLATLCDFSEAASTPTLAELKQVGGVMQTNAAEIGRKKMAIVTAAAVTFGVARQFQALVEPGPLEIRVFTARDEALAWLAVPHQLSDPQGDSE